VNFQKRGFARAVVADDSVRLRQAKRRARVRLSSKEIFLIEVYQGVAYPTCGAGDRCAKVSIPGLMTVVINIDWAAN